MLANVYISPLVLRLIYCKPNTIRNCLTTWRHRLLWYRGFRGNRVSIRVTPFAELEAEFICQQELEGATGGRRNTAVRSGRYSALGMLPVAA